MTLTFSITAGTVIGWIVMFLIPATLFTRNTKAVLCAASAYCLYRLYNLITAFSASEFLFFLAAAAFVIAVILTIIAGFIPSKKAARQDPVVALRTE